MRNEERAWRHLVTERREIASRRALKSDPSGPGPRRPIAECARNSGESGTRMTEPIEPMGPPAQAPALQTTSPIYVRAQRSFLVPFLVGLVFGASCMTCGQLPSPEKDEVTGESGHRVGIVTLEGPIMNTAEAVQQLRRFARQEDIDAVVLRIDSPGGAVAPSQDVFDALRKTSEKKPVVASMGSVAASGGFWAAMGADYVFASSGSITGSIGVISQTPDLRELADFLMVDVHTFKSGPHKDLGNPLREMTEGDRAIFQGLVDDIFEQFVSMIMERRKLDREAVMKVADGRVMTGRAAKEAGLVDELGGLYDAAVKAASLADDKKRAEGGEVGDGPVDPTLVYPAPKDPLLALLSRDFGASLMRGMLDGLNEGLEAASARARSEVRAEW